MISRLSITPLILLLIHGAALPAAEPDRLDHRELLWYPDAHGVRQPVKTADDWKLRRAQILRGMEEAMGALPDRSSLGPIEVHISDTQRADRYTRFTVDFASLFNDRVTAYLYVPAGIRPGEKRPAALALQPTGAQGKQIVDGQGKANRAYGLELAGRGYIVIAPDYPSFGDQKDYDFARSKFASGTMKAICDNMRCVDLLRSRDDVDPAKIVVIGHSLGGHNALFTAAFDPRIAACVTSCGWTPFHHYYGGKKLANWAQPRYMPRVRDVFNADPDRMPFDFQEVIAAIAPRAVFSNSPIGDSNFDVEGVRAAAPEIAKVYKLLGVPDRLVIETPEGGHDFSDAARARAYRFLDGAWSH